MKTEFVQQQEGVGWFWSMAALMIAGQPKP